MVQSFYDTMIAGQRYMLILQGLGFTILIAVCAILIGTVLGCFFALMKVSDRKILKGIANFYTTVLRGIPLATQLMIFYFVIFAPLGMTDTTFHPTEEQIDRISTLYRAHEDEGTNEIIGKRRISNQPESYESGGGGLVSSTDDYLKLGAALANKGTGLNGYQLLKPETVELFRTPQLGEVQHADFTHDFGNMVGYTYCLGARRFIDNRGFAGALGNFGWDGAAGFYILVDPDNDLTIIFAENIMSSGETYRVIHPMVRDLVYMALYYEK